MLRPKTLRNLAVTAYGIVQPLATVGRVLSGLAALGTLLGVWFAADAFGPTWGVVVGLAVLAAVLLLVALHLQTQLDKLNEATFSWNWYSEPAQGDTAFVRLKVTNHGPKSSFSARGEIPHLQASPFDLPWGHDATKTTEIPRDGEAFLNVAAYSGSQFAPFDIGKDGPSYRFHAHRELDSELPQFILVTIFGWEPEQRQKLAFEFKLDGQGEIFVDARQASSTHRVDQR